MFSSQTVLRTTRPIIVSRTSKNQTVNGTAHMRGKQQINSFERVIFLSVSTRSQPMKLRTVRQLWGVEEPRAVSLPKIKANGTFKSGNPHLNFPYFNFNSHIECETDPCALQ